MKLRGYKEPPLSYEHAFHLRIATVREMCRLDPIDDRAARVT